MHVFNKKTLDCAVYKQVVWKKSDLVGCATSFCDDPNQPFDYLVCLFVTAGNFNNELTFTNSQNQTSVCSHTYVEQTPPPPPPCSNCSAGCLSPDKNQTATCSTTSTPPTWNFPTGDVDLSRIGGTITCQVTINGNLNGQGNISITQCGKIVVTGTVNLFNTRIDMDMQGFTPLVDDTYVGPVITFAAGGSGGPTSVRTFNVFSPYNALCSHLVTTATATFIRFYDCNKNPNPTLPPTLPPGTTPDGTNTSVATSSAGSSTSSGAPPKTTPAGGGGGGGNRLAWWVIVLIVFACIIGFILLVGLIILIILGIIKLVATQEEERY